MSRWDLARVRSQQPARRYKVCGPVDGGCSLSMGLIRQQQHYMPSVDSACTGCGYHVCGCPPEYVPHMFRPKPTPPSLARSIQERIDTIERLQGLGMLDTPAQREAVYRVLLDGDYSGFGVKP
jgi:hypothetical protein